MSGQQTLATDLPPITEFAGEFRFLSNFYVADPIRVDGWVSPNAATLVGASVEHVFQAAKCKIAAQMQQTLTADTPAAAKALGRAAVLWDDWDARRVPVMLACLRAKFAPGGDAGDPLALKLVNTSPRLLIEQNTWGDRYWGVSRGAGANMLGRCLMLVRQELNVALAAGIPVGRVRGG